MKKHIRHKKSVPKNTIRISITVEGDLSPFIVFRFKKKYWDALLNLYSYRLGLDKHSKVGQTKIMEHILDVAIAEAQDGKL